ncbi:hypothetical protein ABIA33_000918 [Streptacidiphilus sp. MAP12-16]|uniref:hypothetical protein n=1 Tax=Streptacidiphilus sp. MAP12-16 TaxID=3156300 RepID=UPI003515428C
MSLNRGVAALGAVALVGVATLGVSYGIASSAGQPIPKVSVTSGSTWTQFSPASTCYNGGDPLTAKQLAACGALIQKQANNATAPAISVAPNGTFMISVDKKLTEKGWTASGGQTSLVSETKNYQASNLPVSSVIAAASSTSAAATSGTVLVLEQQGKTIYGAWLFQLNQKSA